MRTQSTSKHGLYVSQTYGRSQLRDITVVTFSFSYSLRLQVEEMLRLLLRLQLYGYEYFVLSFAGAPLVAAHTQAATPFMHRCILQKRAEPTMGSSRWAARGHFHLVSRRLHGTYKTPFRISGGAQVVLCAPWHHGAAGGTSARHIRIGRPGPDSKECLKCFLFFVKDPGQCARLRGRRGPWP